MGINDHPFHGAIVHFPIAFLTFAHSIDIIHHVVTALPSLPVLPGLFAGFAPTLLPTSRLVHTVGLALGLVAVASGVQQAGVQANKPGGVFEADGKTLKPKIITMAKHAVLNDLVIILSAISWYRRYKVEGIVGAEGVPGGFDHLISWLIIPVLFYTASLGGDLVYNYGMGLNIKGTKNTNDSKNL